MTIKLEGLVLAAKRAPIVPVLVVDDVESAGPLAEALIAGGLTIAEVTLRTSAGYGVISAMKQSAPSLLVGAGTVLTPEDATRAVDAGSDFLVSPGMTHALLDGLGVHKSIMIPGVATASEAMQRHADGFDLMKLFPAEIAGGAAALKALSGPLPHLRFMPTGGVTEENAAEYLALPNVFAAGGSWIATRQHVADADWSGIAERGRAAVLLAS